MKVILADSIESTWPEAPAKPAYHGLAGRYVKAVAPYTEADPIAILLQLLTIFGNVVGRGPHCVIDGAVHHLVLFIVLVGGSAYARKGTSLRHAQRVLENSDHTWPRPLFSLSSGEGLISIVRDAGEWLSPAGKVNKIPGVKDKRRLVLATEFASVLRVMRRRDDTLSSVLRQAWDDGHLSNPTKNSPLEATGAHVSLISHITFDELRRDLDQTDISNGFANRFLWGCVRRSNVLATPEEMDEDAYNDFCRAFRRHVEFAKSVGRMRRSVTAETLWAAVFPDLTRERLGLAANVTRRAAPYVMRLACLYALLDPATLRTAQAATPKRRKPPTALVDRDHLESALALWRYCEASTRHVFGDFAADPVADKLLAALQAAGDGLSRSAIFSDVFHRHANRHAITEALKALADAGLATCVRKRTAGRPVERWIATAYVRKDDDA